MRRRARVDDNQAVIVQALRVGGASVEPRLARVGEGVPDLLIGLEGVTYLAEVKRPRGRVRHDQQIWHREWKGSPVLLFYGVEDVLAFLKWARRFAQPPELVPTRNS